MIGYWGWALAVRDRPNPPALVLAGGQGHDDEIDQAVAVVPSHLRLLRPGYLRFADLPGFLGGALVAAYPSYGEGFGLPVLEAMAQGTPVVTSAGTATAEVVGTAAPGDDPAGVLVDPADAPALTDALASLLDDPDRAAAIGAAGARRARTYTWARTAELLVAAYQEVAG